MSDSKDIEIKLKTLKDLPDFDYYCTTPEATEVLKEDIRNLAREWLKSKDIWRYRVDVWIKHFFNLDEEG